MLQKWRSSNWCNSIRSVAEFTFAKNGTRSRFFAFYARFTRTLPAGSPELPFAARARISRACIARARISRACIARLHRAPASRASALRAPVLCAHPHFARLHRAHPHFARPHLGRRQNHDAVCPSPVHSSRRRGMPSRGEAGDEGNRGYPMRGREKRGGCGGLKDCTPSDVRCGERGERIRERSFARREASEGKGCAGRRLSGLCANEMKNAEIWAKFT